MKKSEQNTKELLLKAGREEFLEKGYEKASLRAICKRAGVTTGAVYFFFDSKEEYSLEEVLRLTERIGCYADGGFRSLMKEYGRNQQMEQHKKEM